jgi:prepilin-type N-terminal cleavage/methylation domain-containing protein
MIVESQPGGRVEARAGRGGFTLLELAVAIAVTSVIMVGIGSAMLLAGRALPEAHSPTAGRIAAAAAVEQIVTELQYAVSVSQRSATTIEFGVPDRTGDDALETIRYEWSGVSGAPLTRQYNGGTAINFLADVREFGLSYALKTITTEIPQGNESAQTTLAGYESISSLHDYPIKDTEWYAQYFLPVLPADATSWKVTRVVLQAKQDGSADGEASVQLQAPTVGLFPSGTVLEKNELFESTLMSSYLEQEFTFANAGGLVPTQGICIVVRWVANGTACKVWGRNAGVVNADLLLTKSTDRGATWSTLVNQSLLFTVYGTVTTSGTPQVQNTYRMEAAEIRLRAGNDSRSIVQTGVRLLNKPEVDQ